MAEVSVRVNDDRGTNPRIAPAASADTASAVPPPLCPHIRLGAMTRCRQRRNGRGLPRRRRGNIASETQGAKRPSPRRGVRFPSDVRLPCAAVPPKPEHEACARPQRSPALRRSAAPRRQREVGPRSARRQDPRILRAAGVLSQKGSSFAPAAEAEWMPAFRWRSQTAPPRRRQWTGRFRKRKRLRPAESGASPSGAAPRRRREGEAHESREDDASPESASGPSKKDSGPAWSRGHATTPFRRRSAKRRGVVRSVTDAPGQEANRPAPNDADRPRLAKSMDPEACGRVPKGDACRALARPFAEGRGAAESAHALPASSCRKPRLGRPCFSRRRSFPVRRGLGRFPSRGPAAAVAEDAAKGARFAPPFARP
jgi:hypothetical protein